MTDPTPILPPSGSRNWAEALRIYLSYLTIPVFAVKPADTTRNNTATQAADPDLVVPVAANTVYLIEGFLPYNSNTTADIAFGWTLPAGSTMAWTVNGLQTGATTGQDTIVRGSVNETAVQGVGGAGATDVVALPLGTLTTGTTAGNLTLRWAQNTANVSNTILRANSWIRATPTL